MSDLARWELRGSVRTLRTHFAEWNPETGDWWPLKDRVVATFRTDGQLSEIEHHNPDGSVPREIRLYDDAGRLNEDQWWSNDVMTRRVVHTYDVGGRSASAVTVDVEGRKDAEDHTFSLSTYTYDEKGRRIESVRRMGKLSEERVTVRYDDFDNPVEEVRSDVSREVRMDDGGVRSEERPSHVHYVRFEYRYDAHGNWTERIVWQRLEPNADERPSNIERRTIAYYGH